MIGETRKNSQGTLMKIIAERNTKDIDVEFLDEYHYVKEHVMYTNFLKGHIKNPFDKTIFGIGYLGLSDGMWDTNKPKAEYNTWKNMVERCCVENTKGKFSQKYDKVSCCKEWLCYQTFAEWYKKHIYDVGSERLHLDKDIKYKGNTIYSPYHCIFVPQSINEQFKESSGRKKTVDADLPYTIRRTKTNTNRYEVSFRGKYLGTYDTVEECINIYLERKRNYILELVNKYENMPSNVKEIIINAVQDIR